MRQNAKKWTCSPTNLPFPTICLNGEWIALLAGSLKSASFSALSDEFVLLKGHVLSTRECPP